MPSSGAMIIIRTNINHFIDIRVCYSLLPHWNNQGNKPSFLFECVSPIIIAIPSEESEKWAILRQKAEGTKVVGIFKKVCDFT